MKRLLFISHRAPFPPDKGDRVRAFHELKALSSRFRITLAALRHDDNNPVEPLQQWCEKVILAPAGGWFGLIRGVAAMLKGRSVTEGFFHSGFMREMLLAESRREPFDLVFAYCSSMLQLALDIPAAARVMDLVDIDSMKWADYAASARWPASRLYRWEARGVQKIERRALQTCQAVLCVSDAEAATAPFPTGELTVVGNGVDAEYFTPTPRPAGQGPAVVFTGTMNYRPNVEAVCWFVREVLPALKQAVPKLTFLIVGRSPVRAVRRLERIDGVQVIGDVPDVRPYLSAATVAVAPLQVARGVQNKVLEAMAAGRAVVASPQALEGLDAAPGEHILVADTPNKWQELIVKLLNDDNLRSRLESSARARVEERYAWAARMEPLVSLCERLTDA